MAEKSAIILDTNFIIEHKSDLGEIYDNLSKNNTVYVTEISINERLSQKYLELKSKYEKIEIFKKEYSGYATVKLKNTFEKRYEEEKQRTINSYNKKFGDNIIKFNPDEDALKTVMERVYKKITPFINKEGASDKGFKDTLIWMSVLKYFKDLKEDFNIVFITNDNGFLNNTEDLKIEFAEVTGKTIEIKNNNYIKGLLGAEEPTISIEEKAQQRFIHIDLQTVRDSIESTINAICYIVTYDHWGNEQLEKTFTTNVEFDVDYMKVIFNSLRKDLDKHILENQINAYSILALDDRIKDIHPIPIQALEAVNKLYEDIQIKYPNYLEQFFSAVCNIMNNNLIIQHIPQSCDDELPF